MEVPDLAAELANRANDGDWQARRWILWMIERDDAALAALMRPKVAQVKMSYSHCLNKETGRFELTLTHWRWRLGKDKFPRCPFENQEQVYAYAAMRIFNDDLHHNVKQCEAFAPGSKGSGNDQQTTCPNHFFGRPNKKFCSDNCRTRVNIAAKRDADRKRGML